MRQTKAPEFDPRNPLSSALEVIRAVLLRRPGEFYENFSAEGSVWGPALFAALVSVAASILLTAVVLIWGIFTDGTEPGTVGMTLIQGPVFALITPVAAVVYLLTIHVFVGAPATFGEVYRMLAYSYAALILAWVPLVGAFAIAYALMFLMALAIRAVYKAPLIPATIAALAAFLPVVSAIIFIERAITSAFL